MIDPQYTIPPGALGGKVTLTGQSMDNDTVPEGTAHDRSERYRDEKPEPLPSLAEMRRKAAANRKKYGDLGEEAFYATMEDAKNLTLARRDPPDGHGLKGQAYADHSRDCGYPDKAGRELPRLYDPYGEKVVTYVQTEREKADSRGEPYHYPHWRVLYRYMVKEYEPNTRKGKNSQGPDEALTLADVARDLEQMEAATAARKQMEADYEALKVKAAEKDELLRFADQRIKSEISTREEIADSLARANLIIAELAAENKRLKAEASQNGLDHQDNDDGETVDNDGPEDKYDEGLQLQRWQDDGGSSGEIIDSDVAGGDVRFDWEPMFKRFREAGQQALEVLENGGSCSDVMTICEAVWRARPERIWTIAGYDGDDFDALDVGIVNPLMAHCGPAYYEPEGNAQVVCHARGEILLFDDEAFEVVDKPAREVLWRKRIRAARLGKQGWNMKKLTASVPLTSHEDFDAFVSLMREVVPCNGDRNRFVGYNIMWWDARNGYALAWDNERVVKELAADPAMAPLPVNEEATGEATEAVTSGSGEEMSPEQVADFLEKPTGRS